MRISIIIPIFNESPHLAELLRRVRATPYDKQIICVDDGSTDGSREILGEEELKGDLTVILHDRNRGKGAAVQSGLARVDGDVVIIQDADLEYDPEEYPLLLRPILNGRSQVVYGSRFLGEHKAMYFWHMVGNKALTLVTNILYDTTLTDMETCYKVFTVGVAKRIKLRSPRWGFDPEITARILRAGYRIYEVPISYNGREMFEGKKITWRDGITVLLTLLRCRFFG
ncbi:MAG TPA: glycosyltransferase family 2 protein [Dehalococcoidia bacterium]|nr:glycosyltransferase family 2 protein [Dehalococcoidia bacterium]